MCLIIRGNVSAILEQDTLLTRAHASNKDGWGIMYARDGEIVTAKGFGLNPLVDSLFNVPEDQEAFVHMRFATHGDVAEYNNHPFPLAEGKFALMHNGVIKIDCTIPTYSDTWHWARRVEDVIERDPAKFSCAQAHASWVKEIGWSRVVMLRHDGETVILNEDDGVKWNGLWLSNESHIPGRVRSISYPWRGSSGKSKARQWGRELVDPWRDLSYDYDLDEDEYEVTSYASSKGRESSGVRGLGRQFIDQCPDAFEDPIDRDHNEEQRELWMEEAEDILRDLNALYDEDTMEWFLFDEKIEDWVPEPWSFFSYEDRYKVYRGYFGVRDALEIIGEEWLALDEEYSCETQLEFLDEDESEDESEVRTRVLEPIDPDDALMATGDSEGSLFE